jgi:hypothetical protein
VRRDDPNRHYRRIVRVAQAIIFLTALLTAGLVWLAIEAARTIQGGAW